MNAITRWENCITVSLTFLAAHRRGLGMGGRNPSPWRNGHQKILDELPPAVCNRIKKNLPRDLTKVGQKELLDQFLNADASLI